MRALIGLGNPGEKYEKTRHNAGFMLVDAVAEHFGETKWKRFDDALIIELKVDGEKCFLVKPQQFMNNSGRPIAALAAYYGIEPKDMCIAADDVYVAPGSARVRQTGGDGGHNGWKSVIASLDPDDFWRVRIGAGVYNQDLEGRGNQPALEDYVLQRMPPHDMKQMEKLIDIMVPNLVQWLKHGTLSTETVHI